MAGKKDKWFIAFLDMASTPFWLIWMLGQKVTKRVWLIVAACLVTVSLAEMVL